MVNYKFKKEGDFGSRRSSADSFKSSPIIKPMGNIVTNSPGINSKTFGKNDDPSSVLFTGKYDATTKKAKTRFNLEFPIQMSSTAKPSLSGRNPRGSLATS